MPNHSAKPQGKQHVDAVGYEKRDANAKGIFLAVLGLFIALALVDLIVHWIVSDFRKSPTPGDRFSGSVRQRQAAATEPVYPRLQISPPADLSKLREEEAQELNTYGWINQTAGVVRIPVDRAMELVLQKGLPAREKGQPGRAGVSSYELQLQRAKDKQPETGGPQ
ncbi:MAG: hypothetical protein ACXWIU_04760 [Limisphaerales bacterium]